MLISLDTIFLRRTNHLNKNSWLINSTKNKVSKCSSLMQSWNKNSWVIRVQLSIRRHWSSPTISMISPRSSWPSIFTINWSPSLLVRCLYLTICWVSRKKTSRWIRFTRFKPWKSSNRQRPWRRQSREACYKTTITLLIKGVSGFSNKKYWLKTRLSMTISGTQSYWKKVKN